MITKRTNPKNGFTVLSVHYTADPAKATPEFKAEARKGYTEDQWQQEMEINYIATAGKKFFPGFSKSLHCKPLFYQEGVILRGWDFGYHHPFCAWTAIDQRDRWLILAELMGSDTTIDKFAGNVQKMTATLFPHCSIKDFCDPAGTQKSDKGEKSSIEILNTLGIRPQYRSLPILDGATIIRKRLQIRDDGTPGMLIDDSKCPILVEAFEGGCHYPESDTEVQKEFYEKEGYYEHGVDTLRYISGNRFKVDGATPSAYKNQGNYGRVNQAPSNRPIDSYSWQTRF